jgi:hypothetical protein
MEKSKFTKNEKGKTAQEQSREHGSSLFFDIKGTVHNEFILTGLTVNSAYYNDVLR